jgi:hypothetical protein
MAELGAGSFFGEGALAVGERHLRGPGPPGAVQAAPIAFSLCKSVFYGSGAQAA